MNTYIRKTITKIQTLYEQSHKRGWVLLSIACFGLFILTLVVSFIISRALFIDLSINFIVTAIGMTFTIIFIERRFDKIRKKDEQQRDQKLFERLDEIRKVDEKRHQKLIETLEELQKLEQQRDQEMNRKLNELKEILAPQNRTKAQKDFERIQSPKVNRPSSRSRQSIKK